MKLQAIVSSIEVQGSGHLQSELFLQFGKAEWERSVLMHLVCNDFLDSQILVVRPYELLVFTEMRVLSSNRARFRVTESGTSGEQGVQVSELLVELNEVCCLLDAIKSIDETWSLSHAE